MKAEDGSQEDGWLLAPNSGQAGTVGRQSFNSTTDFCRADYYCPVKKTSSMPL
jgi:hypothetical protein